MKRKLVACVALPTSMLLVAGCGADVARHLDDRREQYASSTAADIFGKEWQEFYVQCPKVTSGDVVSTLGLKVDEVKDNSEADPKEQYVYLRNGAQNLKIEAVARKDVDLCGIFAAERDAKESPSATPTSESAQVSESAKPSEGKKPSESAKPSDKAKPSGTSSSTPSEVSEPASTPGSIFTGWMPADLPLKFEKLERHEPWQLDIEELEKTLAEHEAEQNKQQREEDRERQRGDNRGDSNRPTGTSEASAPETTSPRS